MSLNRALSPLLIGPQMKRDEVAGIDLIEPSELSSPVSAVLFPKKKCGDVSPLRNCRSQVENFHRKDEIRPLHNPPPKISPKGTLWSVERFLPTPLMDERE